MRAYTLILSIPLSNDGVLRDLGPVLHVRIRIVELSQCIGGKPECFCEKRAEIVRELLDLREIFLERLSESREKFLVWPLGQQKYEL